ncbi:MAG: tetratricopeptide repeat protein [Acidobacteria bacterium]|nr:tetratricopeptide repeat protein [Acidobacteriota bacterium]
MENSTLPRVLRGHRILPLLLLLVAATWQAGNGAPKDRYELRGSIVQSDGKPFRGVVPVVFLYGSVTPYTAQAQAGPSGQFKFKNLQPGSYTVVIAVPDAGRLQRTVDVGPSLADARRRVDVTFRFDDGILPDATRIVSALELSIPDRARQQYQKAQERLGKRDIAGAVVSLKKAVGIAPQYVAAWNNLGTIAYQSQDYRQAAEYFREALKHDPEAHAPLVNLGGALLSQGKIQESLAINLQAVRSKPDDALSHSQLGQSYYFLGQLDNAEPHLKRAKELDPGHFSFPQLVLAELYSQKRDYAAMAAELEEFLRYHPDSHPAPAASRSLEWARARVKILHP